MSRRSSLAQRRSLPTIVVRRSSNKAIRYSTSSEPAEQLDFLVNEVCAEDLPCHVGDGRACVQCSGNRQAGDGLGVASGSGCIGAGCRAVCRWIRAGVCAAGRRMRRAMSRCIDVLTTCIRDKNRMPASSVDSTGCRNCRMPLDFSSKTVHVNGPIMPIINPGADSWVEGWQPESTSFGTHRISSTAVVTDEFVVDAQDMNTVPLDTPENERYYRDHFLSQTHLNYCAMDSTTGPIVMSVKYEESASCPAESSYFRIMIRTRDSTICKRISAKLVGDEPQVEDIARIVLPDLNPSLRFQCTVSCDVQNAIVEYDEHAKQCRFKFGILTQSIGQNTEEAIFSNNVVSDQFAQFLKCIATEVDLQGFDGFRGGLDVKGNLSGRKSYFTKFKNREIMFHVSPLMPFSLTDAQQVARKRHIGNDIVCVVFQEESTTFDPNWIASSFLHTYIVVQPVSGTEVPAAGDSAHPSNDSGETLTYYRISICSKKSVPPFSPLVPSTGVFPVTKEFATFFLSLLINAERSSTKAEQFAKLERRTREYLLKDLHQSVLNSCDSPEAAVRDSGRWSGVRKLMPKKSRHASSGVSTTPSQASISSQVSNASSVSTTESVTKESKGLLNFFRGGSATSLKANRVRSQSSSATRDRSTGSIVSLPNSLDPLGPCALNCDNNPRNTKPSPPPSFLETGVALVRSSSVISESGSRSPKTIVTEPDGEADSLDVFASSALESANGGDDFPLVAELTSESLTSAVNILRRTVAGLKEERLQLLREDVAMRAKLAEYEAREVTREKELLEARNETAQLKAKLALSSLHSNEKLLDLTNATATNSISNITPEHCREGMRV